MTPDDLRGADLVVAGIGVTPSGRPRPLAAGSPSRTACSWTPRLRTSVPSVLAVGDIASHAHPVLGRRIRVEHWDTAINQGKVAAHNLAGGDEVYDAMPYFFTDQYDLGMEYVGHAGADDEVVVHGDLDGRQFRAFWIARRPGRRGDARQRLGRHRRPPRRGGLRATSRLPERRLTRIPTRDGPQGRSARVFACGRAGSGVEGVELRLGHGIRVGVEPHVREQRLHDAQRGRRPARPSATGS